MPLLTEGLSPRERKERLAAAILEKRMREERARQSDLGEKGRHGGLLHFIQYFWHVLEPNTPLVIDMQMEAICLHLEAVTRGEIKRLCINVSPGAAKSLIVNVFWPAWEWSAAGQPWQRYVTFAYASHLTERDNGRFRDILLTRDFQEMWGHVFRLTEDGKIKPTNNHTGWKFSSSIRGVGTGERGTRVLNDDLHSVKEGESEAVRSETVRWAREGMSNRLNDMQEDVIILIGQRVHDEDVSAALLNDDLGYVHLSISMEYDPSRRCETDWWQDPRTEEGELASPERYPRDIINKLKRTLGPYAWSAQYQQAPTPRGGGIIKRDWWQLWNEPTYPHCFYRWASADTAYTEKEENDPTGFTAWGIFLDSSGQPNIILLDAWRKRLELHIAARWTDEGTPDQRHRRVVQWQKAAQAEHRAMQANGQAIQEPLIDPTVTPWSTYIATGQNEAQRWPAETYEIWKLRTQGKWGLCEWLAHSCRRFKIDDLIIEGKATGLTVAQELRRLNGNEGWGILTVTPEGDKTARLYSVHATFSAGLVYAPDREWAQMVIDEVTSFPKGRYKDLTDSTSQALKHVRERQMLLRPEERQLAADLSAQYRPQSKSLYPV